MNFKSLILGAGLAMALTARAAAPLAPVVNDGFGDFMLVPAGAFKISETATRASVRSTRSNSTPTTSASSR